ncbi:hypothetical protein SELMODRAFT_407461 [Selaginella moellendorffii]|uniref:Uncharacterized protein n=1 Tax=Selaginella moellendorffii TaxID=88036 RepID=D8R5P4_SELML|nr:hypothetical protein SELMODRAFT_407461 [Selaginella moellendorffii]
MARTEQERSGCVTGLWSLFRPKKAHKGDNKVHPEAMDAAASKLKVQDRVCEAVSGEAMDAAALKLKELRHEVKIVLEAIRQERGHKEPIKPIKPEQEKEDEEENQEKKAEQLKEEKSAEQVNEEEKEADQMKPMKLEQEEEKEAEKQLKEEEQEKKAEQLSEEEQEKEAHETKELRREVKQEQGHKEQPQLEREEKNQPNQPIKPIKPMKQEQEQEEEQRMKPMKQQLEQEEEQMIKPMKQQLEQEEEQMIKPIKQPLEREDDQEKMKQQENDKPKQEEQRPKPILLPAGGRRPGSRPKMVRFSSSAEDILPDGTRRRSETHLSDGRGGYVEFAYLEAFHKANRWLNQRGKTEKKIRSLEEEKREETEEEKHEEKSWSVSALRILIRLTEQLYEELNGKSSDRERIKRARKMMRLQKMLDRIPSERKPWKKLQSGEVVFVKEAKELYDRAGRDFVAEFKRRQRAEVNDECLFCRNHDGEKMIGRAGANSKTTRPWVYLRREHEQTVLSTSKKREMKLAPSSRSWLQGLAEKSITLRASKQARDPPPHSSKSREDQWIKLGYTLQCLEQGGISLIGFPVDGDDSGAPAALKLLATGVSDGCGDYKTDYAKRSLSSGGMRMKAEAEDKPRDQRAQLDRSICQRRRRNENWKIEKSAARIGHVEASTRTLALEKPALKINLFEEISSLDSKVSELYKTVAQMKQLKQSKVTVDDRVSEQSASRALEVEQSPSNFVVRHLTESTLSRIALTGAWMIVYQPGTITQEDDDGEMISNSKKLLVAVEPELRILKD